MMDHRGPIVNTTVVHHNQPMTREDPQMKLRLPAELKDVLTAAAQENNRSLNAEVVKRLEDSVTNAGAGKAPVVDEYTLDLFAEKVGQVLDAREKKRPKR
ncbi:Arc family DNA-binding protein [Burkholderia sp. Bp9090]|uniref:Arc family DNA-binding protein n=1 Tax=Burkholderia sp. Bp9090 TaxID=2184567 RepID=UPI0028932C77|nr:Arc family DNA-binding protein [Burkholderia sp. Bp9090]